LIQLQFPATNTAHPVGFRGQQKINYYMWKICCGEPQHLANWPAGFGKICRGKLWFLIISSRYQQNQWPPWNTVLTWHTTEQSKKRQYETLDDIKMHLPAAGAEG